MVSTDQNGCSAVGDGSQSTLGREGAEGAAEGERGEQRERGAPPQPHPTRLGCFEFSYTLCMGPDLSCLLAIVRLSRSQDLGRNLKSSVTAFNSAYQAMDPHINIMIELNVPAGPCAPHPCPCSPHRRCAAPARRMAHPSPSRSLTLRCATLEMYHASVPHLISMLAHHSVVRPMWTDWHPVYDHAVEASMRSD